MDAGLRMNEMKLLIIEDDKKTASFIAKGFKEAGMVVDVHHDGMEGLDAALVHNYDAAVIDLMLPGMDGLSIIGKMREEDVMTPVIILSAKRTVSDRIAGLQKGGDDYMVKPFSFSELLARVQALVRRSAAQVQTGGGNDSLGEKMHLADLVMDPWKHEARRGDEVFALQAREFALLEFLMRNQGHIVSKTSILESVYDYSFDPQSNVVDVLVCRLRNKIDKGFEKKLLHTVRGMGYVLKAV
jgi:two-component system OmpR family response regulator